MSNIQVMEPQSTTSQEQQPAQRPQIPPLEWSKEIQIRSNQELSKLLKYSSPKALTWLGMNKSSHYSILSIRKKNGTSRVLHNPDTLLRGAQYHILNGILNNIKVPEYIWAFERNKSIPAMARLHTNKEFVISVDIKDFFTSIKQHYLMEVFTSLGIAEKPARTLSELCTYKSFVPQGALTSPKIANLVTAATFGPIIKAYCDTKPCLTMTIYADDITISSTDSTIDVSEILQEVSNAIRCAGFRVNREKTKVMRKKNRQYVCGVVVNKKTNMLKKDRYKLRAIVHNTTKNGIEAEALKSSVESGIFASHIKGKINWLKQLNPSLGKKSDDKFEAYLETLLTPSALDNTKIETETEAGTSKSITEPEALPW